MAQYGLVVACRDLPINIFSQSFQGFSDTGEAEYRNARRKFDIVTFILMKLISYMRCTALKVNTLGDSHVLVDFNIKDIA